MEHLRDDGGWISRGRHLFHGGRLTDPRSGGQRRGVAVDHPAHRGEDEQDRKTYPHPVVGALHGPEPSQERGFVTSHINGRSSYVG